MSWLHCFWGIGAALSPVVMSYFLRTKGRWDMGYRTVSILQFALVAVLLVSLPLWKKVAGDRRTEKENGGVSIGFSKALKQPGVKEALTAFFCYCGLEASVGLWGVSYLVLVREIPPEKAASWVSLYYIGITAGRFLSGFLSIKIRQKRMVQLGQVLVAFGILLLFLPFKNIALVSGLFVIGLGCAPIFPGLLHETPRNFGKEYSQTVMGMQMAGAYTGSTLFPPLFGFLGSRIGYGYFPVFLALLLAIMGLMVVLLYKRVSGVRSDEG